MTRGDSSPVMDVLVIGAGMAGLTAARELTRAGFSTSVVEGRDRIGGRVHSIRDFCDEPIEGGAEFVHGSGAATWPEVEAAGFEVRACPLMRHTMLGLGGEPRWLPWVLLRPRVWTTFGIFRSVSRFKPPDMSAREFIETRKFRGIARTIAEMVLTTHLPGSVDEVGLLGLVEDGVLRLENGLNHRITEGYDSLPRAIAAGLDIQLGFELESIRWGGDGITLRSVDGRERRARAAVTTLPVGVLKSGSIDFVPELPEAKHSALAHIQMGPVLKVLLLFQEPFWPAWLANLGCGTGPVSLYWPVFYGATGKPPVLVAYCTGPRAAELSKVTEEEAAEIVVADLCQLFPNADPRGGLLSYRRIDWAADPFSRGGYTFLAPGGSGARPRLAAPTPPLFWAGSATQSSPIAATVEAAYLSGLRAANEVRGFLGDEGA